MEEFRFQAGKSNWKFRFVILRIRTDRIRFAYFPEIENACFRLSRLICIMCHSVDFEYIELVILIFWFIWRSSIDEKERNGTSITRKLRIIVISFFSICTFVLLSHSFSLCLSHSLTHSLFFSLSFTLSPHLYLIFTASWCTRVRGGVKLIFSGV